MAGQQASNRRQPLAGTEDRDSHQNDIRITKNPGMMGWRPVSNATERLEGVYTAQNLYQNNFQGG